MRKLFTVGLTPIYRRHLVYGLGAGLAYVGFAAYGPALPALSLVLTSSLPLVEKTEAFLIPLMSLASEYGSSGAWVVILHAVLLGLNMALLTAYVSGRLFVPGQQILSSLTALTVSVIGLGCVSCGTVLATLFLAIFGGASSTFIPQIGAYVNAGAVVLYAASITLLIRQMRKPAVC